MSVGTWGRDRGVRVAGSELDFQNGELVAPSQAAYSLRLQGVPYVCFSELKIFNPSTASTF